MEKSLLLVQWQEEGHSTEFKIKKLKTDLKIPISQKKNSTNLLKNSRMPLPKVKSNKEDGQNGFTECQNLQSIFIAQF